MKAFDRSGRCVLVGVEHPGRCPSCGYVNLGRLPGEKVVCGADDEAAWRRGPNPPGVKPSGPFGCGQPFIRPYGRTVIDRHRLSIEEIDRRATMEGDFPDRVTDIQKMKEEERRKRAAESSDWTPL